MDANQIILMQVVNAAMRKGQGVDTEKKCEIFFQTELEEIHLVENLSS